MSETLYLTGSWFNLFKRGGAVVVSPTEDSTGPASLLSDDDPATAHIAGSVATDGYLKVRNNALSNGGFEGAITQWADNDQGTGLSAATTTAGNFRSGAAGLSVQGTDSSNYGSRTQDIVVAAGEFRKATTYIRALVTGSTGKVYIRNLRTGRYLQSDLTWASSRNPVLSSSDMSAYGSIVASTATYQVESFDVCMADTVTLRWELACDDGTAAFDDCIDCMGVTWVSVHGHNHGDGISPSLQSSDDDSSWTTRASMTKQRGAYYDTCSIVYAEYWRILLGGTNDEPTYEGEAVIGQYSTSSTNPKWGYTLTKNLSGMRQMSSSGRPSVFLTASEPTIDAGFTFKAKSAARSSELADSLRLRSGQGRYPIVIAPLSDEPLVLYGHLLGPAVTTRTFLNVYETSLELSGAPFPIVGP